MIYVSKTEEIVVSTMDFRSIVRRQVFADAVDTLNDKNFAALATVYLLSADHELWKQAEPHIVRSSIDFNYFKPRNISEDGYALYCCARDLYLGTRHITISDLANPKLISNRLFSLVCNAMKIRRFGLRAIKSGEQIGDEPHA